MRDRTASRNYSPAGAEFRRTHERHRAWGLTQRHAERLRQLRDRPRDSRPAHTGQQPRRSPSAPARESVATAQASHPAPRRVSVISQEPAHPRVRLDIQPPAPGVADLHSRTWQAGQAARPADPHRSPPAPLDRPAEDDQSKPATRPAHDDLREPTPRPAHHSQQEPTPRPAHHSQQEPTPRPAHHSQQEPTPRPAHHSQQEPGARSAVPENRRSSARRRKLRPSGTGLPHRVGRRPAPTIPDGPRRDASADRGPLRSRECDATIVDCGVRTRGPPETKSRY
jgi:hypothetical protein